MLRAFFGMIGAFLRVSETIRGPQWLLTPPPLKPFKGLCGIFRRIFFRFNKNMFFNHFWVYFLFLTPKTPYNQIELIETRLLVGVRCL